MSTPPGVRPGSRLASSPPRKTYSDFLTRTNDDWNVNVNDDDDDDENDEENGNPEKGSRNEDEDEDEFGLPSIASLRRKKKRSSANRSHDPGGGGSRYPVILGVPRKAGFGTDRLTPLSSKRISGSADIAEERGTILTYPTPKKSEGKILRPQYKEILRGLQSSREFLHEVLTHYVPYRPSQFPSSHQPSSTAN